ncbi:MAG TPA: thioredoxin-dependent thiol peroxidase [Acidobacteriota bacterium]|nr:thioredoxin-dependent thiol peroxidase [Acidobacteriota bacterium]
MSEKRLKEGDKAPDFKATTDEGRELSLSDLRGKRVVLYFYPRDNTSGCTKQACALRDAYPEIEEKNAVVLGVSPDSQSSHAKFRDKYDLPFRLLVDDDHSIAQAYGVWAEKSMYGRKFMGILRSQFVIDEEGTVVEARYRISPKDSAPKAVAALA